MFVCFCSEHAAVEITFSKAQMHLLKSQGPDEHFGICVPGSRAGLWEKNWSKADVQTRNAHSPAPF